MNNNINLDTYRMNKVMRHKLRNLCAGIKMTVERISVITASSFPQIPSRCDIIISELDNLREFTYRMDLIFDKLPSPEPKSLFDIIVYLRNMFIKNFPLCSLELNGDEENLIFKDGSLIILALRELLINAGEASGDNTSVYFSWVHNENEFVFKITNRGKIEGEVDLTSPIPFTTTKSKHDGLGLTIAHTIANEISCELKFLYDKEKGVIHSNFSVPLQGFDCVEN